MARFRAILLCGLALVSLASAGTSLDPVVAAVRSQVRPEDAMKRMRRSYATDRWFTFPKFKETAEYVAGAMRDAGLTEVEISGAPADGHTQAGYWTMPMAWDVQNATLEIVDPALPEAERFLADYRKIPASVGMWSGPTPPGGVTAELVKLPAKNRDEIPKMDLRGKIVVGPDARDIKAALAKAGALGGINTFTENPSLRDGRQWINGWGDNGWAFTKDNAPLLSFSISPHQTELIGRLLEKGSVKVKAIVDSRYYSGIYPYVTGVIRGSHPEEEVLLLGHMSEQGAQDNATGVAAMLEAMATLNRLIEGGKLPRPRRTIRLFTMGEMYGSMYYAATHMERMKRTFAAMCLDTPAASYDIAGTEYTLYMNPHAASSWVDALILKVAEAYFPLVNRPWHEQAYAVGTDTYLSDPMIGVPTTWAYSGSGVETHHNSEDTPDRVDPRSLRDVTAVTASFMYFAASADAGNAGWLAEITASRGFHKITHAASEAIDKVLAAGASEGIAREEQAGIEQVRYTRERQVRAVESVMRVAPEASAVTETLSRSLREFEAGQVERLRAAARRRAAVLKVRLSSAVPAVGSDEASKMIVTRNRFGTIPLDELPVEQREGYPSSAWAIVPITALYWTDGQRPLSEVIRLTRLELGGDKFDYVGYFRFLARHGYVRIREAE